MVARRSGGDLMPELGYKPVNKYLPPRAARMPARPAVGAVAPAIDCLPPAIACCGGSIGCCPADRRPSATGMHPALSIVFFTTASGAGFALLLLLGVLVPLGLLPPAASFGFAALAVAVVLAAGGLASSVLHLGRPERAWRAFSQWRSSWLSREGVFSVLTFLPAAAFGIGWVFFGITSGLIGLCESSPPPSRRRRSIALA